MTKSALIWSTAKNRGIILGCAVLATNYFSQSFGDFDDKICTYKLWSTAKNMDILGCAVVVTNYFFPSFGVFDDKIFTYMVHGKEQGNTWLRSSCYQLLFSNFW